MPQANANAKNAMSDNRRWEARVDAQIKVQVVRGRRTIAFETFDVSFRGLFLRTDEPPPIRSLLRLRVKLPQREIEAHAMAVHVTSPSNASESGASDGRGAGVGLQFWGLAGPDRVAWDDFVRELLLRQRTAAKTMAMAMAAAKAKTVVVAELSPESASGVRRTPKG